MNQTPQHRDRVAIYARMSTDKQSADSPADQIAQCREFAQARDWRVVESLVVADAGISGASRHNRPRLLDLVDRIEEWDVLLCFDFSRLARDSEDLGWTRNRLRVHKRKAFETSTGLDVFNVGSKVMGVLNEEYLVKLRADVQRGLRGRVERGFSAGGHAYGYRSELVPSGKVDPHGNEIAAGFRLVVDPQKAAVVQRIYALYNRGEGFRSICHALNGDGIPSPRNKGWAPSAVRELVRNPIYRGEYVWNRSEWIKDHETGKRKRHERPESEWFRQRDERWRIVSDEQWEAVQSRMARRGSTYRRSADGRLQGTRGGAGHRARGEHFLSGLLACSECGGAFYGVKAPQRLRCSWAIDRGAAVCSSCLVVARTDLEDRVLGAVRERILTPENLTYAVEKALDIVGEKLATRDLGADRKRLLEIEAQLDRAARLAVKTGGIEAATRIIGELDAERVKIERRLANDSPAPEMNTLRQVIEDRCQEMATAFEASPAEGRAALLALLGDRRIQVGTDAERGFSVEGIFELSLIHEPPRSNHASEGACVVAGEGFEPPTSGL